MNLKELRRRSAGQQQEQRPVCRAAYRTLFQRGTAGCSADLTQGAKKKEYSLNQGVSTQQKTKASVNKNTKNDLNKNKTSKNKEYNLKSNNKVNSGIQKNTIIEEN